MILFPVGYSINCRTLVIFNITFYQGLFFFGDTVTEKYHGHMFFKDLKKKLTQLSQNNKT